VDEIGAKGQSGKATKWQSEKRVTKGQSVKVTKRQTGKKKIKEKQFQDNPK
jgi:hypothetical protein